MMIKLRLLFLIGIWLVPFLAVAQSGVKGTITNQQKQPIEKVKVTIQDTEFATVTLPDGTFTLLAPAGNYTLVIDDERFNLYSQPVTIGENSITEIPAIPLIGLDRPGGNPEIPIVTLTETELSEGEGSAGDVAGLLSASSDIYGRTAGYQFGATRYRIRGFDSEQSEVAMNGITMNDAENGTAFWSTWGGLNDATRNATDIYGTGFSDAGFGNVGGYTNIVTRASEYRKQTKLTYSLTNRSYRNRIMATYSSGMTEKGWAVTVSGSRRWADEGYVEGTFYDAWSYFVAVEKKLNSRHSLNFTGFGAPRKYGKSGPATQEAYDLSGSNYYNPYWGYQNGKKRNSRVSDFHAPVLMLTHYFNINQKMKLETSAGYTFGKGETTDLTWLTGNDPRPAYYRNMPSFYATKYNDAEGYQQAYNDWTTNVNRRQVDWEKFYTANRSRLATVYDANGVEGNTVTGLQSNYMIESRHSDNKQIMANTVFNHAVSDKFHYNIGASLSINKGYEYKTVNDLLGGDFWLDINKYVDSVITDDSQYSIYANNDMNHPNKVAKVGDRIGYDYVSNVNAYNLFGQVHYEIEKFIIQAGLKVTQTTFWRTGNMKNGTHPDDSYGDSEKANFTTFASKLGITYKISGRHYLIGNVAYQTEAPYFRNSFETSRTSNALISGLTPLKTLATDLTYQVRLPKVTGRFTGFYNTITDEITVTNIYMDGFKEGDQGVFGSYILNGVDRQQYGLEFGAEASITSSVQLKMAAGTGNYYYSSRPEILQVSDAGDRKPLGTAYIKNFKVGGFPQTAGTIGLEYRGKAYWFVGVSANYFDHIYVEIYPTRRTELLLSNNYTTDNPKWDAFADQEKLKGQGTLDLYAGKSFKIDNYYLGINLNVNNVLNNTSLAFGGFEQYRIDYSNPEVFQPKYLYMYGTQYFLNINLRF